MNLYVPNPYGTDVFLKMPTVMDAPMAGTRNVYGQATFKVGLALPEIRVATYTVTGAPSVLSVTPNTGGGDTARFDVLLNAAGGAATIRTAGLLVNTTGSNANACSAEYRTADNRFYLRDDAGANWLAGVAAGSGLQVSNSQCTLTAEPGPVPSVTQLTVRFNLAFKGAFFGAKNLYASVFDVNGSGTPNTSVGAWTAGVVPAIDLADYSGAGMSSTFSFRYTDSYGADSLTVAQAVFTGGGAATQNCSIVHQSGALYLKADNGTDLIGPLAFGSAGTVENSQCRLAGTGASAVRSGYGLTLAVPVTFKAAFSGLRQVLLNAVDASGLQSNWQMRGNWNVTGVTTNVLPVSNPGFEARTTFTEVSGNQYWNLTAPPGWSASNASDARFAYGITAREGMNNAYLSGPGWLEQTLGVNATANATYALSVAIGRRSDLATGQYKIELFAGENLLGSLTGDQANIGPGKWQVKTLTATSGSSEGLPLKVRITSLGATQIEADDVRLEQVSGVWSPVAVVNPGFEADPSYNSAPFTDACGFAHSYGTPVTGWTVTGLGGGWRTAQCGSNYLDPYEGKNLGYAENNGKLTQVLLGSTPANMTYLVSVAVGRRADMLTTPYSVTLKSGSTVLGSLYSNSNELPTLGYVVKTLQVNSGGNTGALTLELASNGASQVAFDDVRVYQNGAAPPPPSGPFRRAVTIDHTKVVNTAQTNFPVLISGTYSYLATVANGGKVRNANGYDIYFASDSAGTQRLAHEVESYNATTGALTAWVKASSVSAATDTVIYMIYGDASITTSQENKTGVWDSSYKAVYHMANGLTDSTGNASHGTVSGVSAQSGQIGSGLAFNGSSSYGTIPQAVFGYPNSGSTTSYGLTFESWFRTTAAGVLLGQTNGTQLPAIPTGFVPAAYVGADGLVRASVFYHSDTNTSLANRSGRDDVWHHVAATYAAGTENLYVDGVLLGQRSSVAEVGYSGNYFYALGAGYAVTWPSAPGSGWSYLNGRMDEARVSNAARSGDWVKTEYNNQNSPSTFYSVGVEQ